jgi:hypothetical protein
MQLFWAVIQKHWLVVLSLAANLHMVDKPIEADERLVREWDSFVVISDAFASRVTIAWPSTCVCSFLSLVNLIFGYI